MHILFNLQASLKNLDWGWASSNLDIFDNGGVDSCSHTKQHSWHFSFHKTSALLTFAADLLKDTVLLLVHLSPVGLQDDLLELTSLRITGGGQQGWKWPTDGTGDIPSGSSVNYREQQQFLWVALILLSGDRLIMYRYCHFLALG